MGGQSYILRYAQTNAAITTALEANRTSIAKPRGFEKNSDDSVRKRVASVTPTSARGRAHSPPVSRPRGFLACLNPPPLLLVHSLKPRSTRLSKGEITEEEYEKFIEKETKSAVRFQERIGLDLLVHGEPERNDLVQYFRERLSGFVFTQNAWVQFYGSRYVRPPTIVSDVTRKEPMTVRWSKYAQSFTSKPMKGMLTGPVTILNWSFPRVDISREIQAQQLALALRDEVIDLEAAGIKAIQVDEPALREGLPLRRADWNSYLNWAGNSFKLSTAGVGDHTQTHSHFCYSDDIFPHLVILIEAPKSDLKLINTFRHYGYSNNIGPGVYDVRSPRVPGNVEIQERLKAMLAYLDQSLLYVNPDCGLKTRGWKETEASLINLVEAARWARQNHA
ncbi:hypothetical protein GYMLUDRAFT_58929 [Collybiopsis luxurians FD-317 M1]|uniref:Cobalamin-independent methionine synthase MetE C-terminal/archaeal domain-containing protein n=1 Tax=Collybiopsis luxurians FD-317 M1 TaxID=944289 RepID=A0A0D0BZR2_9AGAR|nr:hypothetical protein GYMLUDRAFT_58929 [Collybiopsis luxurians FD-317 M1]